MGAFDFAPYVGPALGILGGLFGGGSKTNKQAQQDLGTSRQYLGDQAGVAGQIGGQATRYGSLADYAAGNYGTDDPAMRTATQNEISYLQENPNTDQADAQYLANATAGQAAAYQGAGANLTASLAARGLSDSSNAAGGLTSLAQAQAAASANAADSLAQHQVSQADANRRGIIGLETGLANTDYSHETQALGAQTGALGSEAGEYGNLAGAYKGLGEYEQGQQNAQDAAQAQQWAGIGASVGNAVDGPDDTTDAQNALLNAQAGYYKSLSNPTGAIPGVSSTPGIAPSAAGGVVSLDAYDPSTLAATGLGSGGTYDPFLNPTGAADNTGGVSPVPATLADYARSGYASGVTPVPASTPGLASLGPLGGTPPAAPFALPPAVMQLTTPKAKAWTAWYTGGKVGAPPKGMDEGDLKDAEALYKTNDPTAIASYRSGDIDPLDIKGG